MWRGLLFLAGGIFFNNTKIENMKISTFLSLQGLEDKCLINNDGEDVWLVDLLKDFREFEARHNEEE